MILAQIDDSVKEKKKLRDTGIGIYSKLPNKLGKSENKY